MVTLQYHKKWVPDAQTLRTEFTYDTAGNVTEMRDYRYENGTKTLYRFTEKRYDGFGCMTSEAEVDCDGSDSVRALNILGESGNIIASERSGGATKAYYFYNKDMRGSTTSILDGTGTCRSSYQYSGFGETTANSDFYNEIAYTGGIWDKNTGLYYLNARYYDPGDGRFLTEDTYRGNTEDPGSLHLYVYCANNPVNYVDPSGHKTVALGYGVQFDVAFGGSWISASAGLDILYLSKKVKKRYKNQPIHAYYHKSGNLNASESTAVLNKAAKSPSKLLSLSGIKSIIKSNMSASCLFFMIWGDTKKFKSHKDYRGYTGSLTLTIKHITISVGFANKSTSYGLGFSTAKYGYSNSISNAKFKSSWTDKFLSISSNVMKSIKSKASGKGRRRKR